MSAYDKKTDSLRAMNSIGMLFPIIIRFWNLTIPKLTAKDPSSSGRLMTSTSSGGSVAPRSISSKVEAGLKSGDNLRRWNKGWSEVTRQAYRISEIASCESGEEKDKRAVRRSGTCVDSSWVSSGFRFTIAQ